jgi:DNA-binding IclR family transcriptional regulator
MVKKTENPSSVEKALKILMFLANRHEGMGTGELSQELDISAPTASRLLSILSKNEFVRKNPVGKKYVLGKSALDIGRFAYRHIGSQLIPIAKPYIDSLRDTIEESAVLEVLAGDSVIIVYRASGPNVVSISVKSGTMVPAHVSPGAKSILAFSLPDIVDSVLKINLPRYTPKTITDIELLKKSFEEIRRKGVAFASGEYNMEVNSMGAPVFNKDGEPIAAVVITMPRYRTKYHKQATLVSNLKETAANISKSLYRHGI